MYGLRRWPFSSFDYRKGNNVSSPEEIKALIRASLATYIAAHPGEPGIALIHMDIAVDALYNGFTKESNAIDLWNPSSGLPTNPQNLDTYIASGTGNGWTDKNTYTRLNGQWVETLFSPGKLIFVINKNNFYGSYNEGWKVLGGSGATTNPLMLSNSVRLQAVMVNNLPEFWVELSRNGGVTWEKQQRLYLKPV